MPSSRIVRPSVATLVLALLFAVPENTRANVTYRPGLMQAQILSGSSNGFATEANGVPNLASNLIAIAQSDDKVSVERASGVLMDGSSSTANPVTGTSFSWPEKYGVFAYEGEIHVTADTTYRFYGQFDDGEALVVDGVTAVNQGANSGYSKAPAVRNPYAAASTGWVPFNAWIWDWTGGKAPHTSLYALEWNADNVDSDFGNSAKWSQFRDDGSMTFLRTDTGETFTTIHSAEVSGNNLVLNVSFANVPASSTLVAYFGNSDGGTSSAGWDSSVPLGTISAGNTVETPLTVTGAGTAGYLRLCLSNPTKTSGDDFASVFEEWTDPVNRDPAPAISLSLSSISYTNAVYEARISSFGFGASSCDLVFEISGNDSFDPVAVAVSSSGVTSASAVFPVSGLLTNTVYYARVTGTNNKQNTGVSSIVSGTTLTPGNPECQVESVVSGLTTLSVTGKATAFGAGATSATMRLEASADAGFATLAGFAERSVALGESETLAISGLAPDTEYRLRLRLVNDWGLETSTNLLATATLDAPIVASGIRRTFASDISTVDVFFDITAVFDGATGTATLYCDENTEPVTNRGVKAVSAPGTLTWAAIPFGGNAYHAKVVLVSEANNVTYTQTWSAVVDHSFKRFRPEKFDTDPDFAIVEVPEGETSTISRPGNVFDGDLSTGVRAVAGYSIIGKLAEMLEVPEDQEVYVTRIDVTHDGNSNYSLYTSEDGSTWTLVEGVTNVAHTGTASYTVSTVANFVKCTFESSSGYLTSLYEIEAWGFVKEKPKEISRNAFNRGIATFHNANGSAMSSNGTGGYNNNPNRLFDGNMTNYQMWPRAGTGGYVVVDFTKNDGTGGTLKEYFVTELWVGANGTKKFTLQYTQDGSTWIDVDGAVAVTCDGIGKYSVGKVAKAVRYVWTEGSWDGFSYEYLAEFQVWGINPNDAPCDHPNYSDWEIGAVPATCTEKSRDQRKCLVCGAKFNRVSVDSSPLGHDYVTTLARPGRFSRRKDFPDLRRYGSGSITCSRCGFRLDFPTALDLVTNKVDGVRICGEKTEGIVRFTDMSASSENNPQWGPGKKKIIDEVWNVSQEWPYWTTTSTNAQYADFEFGTTIDLTEVELSVYNHGYGFDFCSVDDAEGTETAFCSISIAREEEVEAHLETVEVDIPETGRTKELLVQKMATVDYQRIRIPFFETPVKHLRIRIVDEEPIDMWGHKGIRVIEIHPWGTVLGASDFQSPKTTLMILR